ncbi:MAG: hypothetical protein A4E28_02103 [Methanocella sp. PtaU1.Bin125]|nr:MAG: hypothetical protein A4E28_02103 [Methanocella sp. PtaU1.Bin125]
MSITMKLIGIIRNSLFVRRDQNHPENEMPETANTLEDIVRQVKEEAADSRRTLDVNEFFAPTYVMAGKASHVPAAFVNRDAVAGPHKEKAKMRIRLTADQYEALIEKDLIVLEIIGRVMDRNVAARSRIKAGPT